MKRLLFFLTVATLVSCGRTFEQRTAKYAEVGSVNLKSSISIDCTECPEGLHHTLLACLCMICPVNYNITALKHLIYITITALIMCA